jgi:NAD(P)-dependent dehydrogenase (short-subunit alcohol dehydrogenase family)
VQLDGTRGLLREQGVPAGRISVVPADLADEGQSAMAAASVLAAGRVDILVNNAATVEPLGPTAGVAAGDLRPAPDVPLAVVAGFRDHRQRAPSQLLDGDDVDRLNHRPARQQVADDLAEGLRGGPVDVRGPRNGPRRPGTRTR